MKERRKRLAALFAAFCLVLMLLPVPAVRAEDGNGYTYIAPTLSKSADPYDPEKPEELSADQLYAKAAILIEATTGDVIFEKNAGGGGQLHHRPAGGGDYQFSGSALRHHDPFRQ